MNQNSLRNKIDSIFGSLDGVPSHFTEFEKRPQQKEIAQNIYTALINQTPLIIEAPPGIGKTLAYLIPASIWLSEHPDERVIVSTGTRALQKQIVQSDSKKLSAFIPNPPEVRAMYGSENYLCARRYNSLIANTADLLEQDHRSLLLELDPIVNGAVCRTVHSVREHFKSLPAQAWDLIVRDQYSCKAAICKASKCSYLEERKSCKSANILVVNHALLIADLQAGQGSILGKYGALIIDEAHLFDDYAARAGGFQVSYSKIRNVLSGIHSTKTKKGMLKKMGVGKTSIARISKDIEYLNKTSAEVFRRMRLKTASSSFEAVSNLAEGLSKLGRFIQNSISNLVSDDESKADIESVLARLFEISRHLDEWVMRSEEKAYWFNDESGGSFHSALLTPADLLNDRLYKQCSRIIFLSSTLATAAGDFSYFKSRIGLSTKNTGENSYDSPFNFKTQAALYIDTQAPTPKNNEIQFRSHVNSEMLNICKILKGRTLCLFTSKSHLAEATEFFKKNNVSVFSQASMPAAEITKSFVDDPSKPILGVASFWTGIDLPEHAIKAILIARIPFDSISDERVAAIRKQIDDSGGDSFKEYMLPNATLMLKQGFGRLVRSRKHSGVVCIFDQRMNTMSYGKKLMAALPKTKLLSNKKDLEQYIRTL